MQDDCKLILGNVKGLWIRLVKVVQCSERIEMSSIQRFRPRSSVIYLGLFSFAPPALTET
jgi:hypothetical protein